jgi:hypothetical protein
MEWLTDTQTRKLKHKNRCAKFKKIKQTSSVVSFMFRQVFHQTRTNRVRPLTVVSNSAINRNESALLPRSEIKQIHRQGAHNLWGPQYKYRNIIYSANLHSMICWLLLVSPKSCMCVAHPTHTSWKKLRLCLYCDKYWFCAKWKTISKRHSTSLKVIQTENTRLQKLITYNPLIGRLPLKTHGRLLTSCVPNTHNTRVKWFVLRFKLRIQTGHLILLG